MNTDRFDPLWAEAHRAYGDVTKFRRRLANNVAGFRRAAYRFAFAVKHMNEEFHNEFLSMIASEKLNIAQWMNSHFEMIEAMGDTRERIFLAIENGCTEAEYVKEGEIYLARKRVKNAATLTEVPVPPPLKEPATVGEKLAKAEETVQALRTNLKKAKRELSQTQKDLAHAVTRIDQLERAVKRTNKTLAQVA